MTDAEGRTVDVVRLHAAGDVRVQREPVARPKPGEVRLRVSAIGLCGSDIRWYEEGAIGDVRLARPLVLGHEFAGVIEDGDDAGQRVVADPADPCRACEPCTSGWPNLCATGCFAGHGETDGALRARMAWPRHLLHALPEGVTDDEATLLEPLGVALHAVDLGRPRPGGSAGVFGCGPLGLLLIQVLRSAGVSTIIASDPLEHRLSAALSLGATDAQAGGGGGAVGARPEAGSVDAAFEVAGDDGALANAIRAVRPGGRVVLVGIPPRDRTSFPASLARRKGVSMLVCRRMHPNDLPRAIRLASTGRVALSPLISHRFRLREAPGAFAALAARGGLKVVVLANAAGS